MLVETDTVLNVLWFVCVCVCVRVSEIAVTRYNSVEICALSVNLSVCDITFYYLCLTSRCDLDL